ncbi:MAG: dihydropteroate synthase [Rhodospirillales bacterium]
MGIVNVTPDSFSDGGEALSPDAAIARGFTLCAEGADIIDVGGESTRPGSEAVPVEEELARVIPVVKALAAAGLLVSIDTRHARVMAAAIDAGVRIVNDVTALTGDAAALSLVVRSGVSVVLMHMQGQPRTMQRNPTYGDPVTEVQAWLAARVSACEAAGIALDRIAVDPGIGFGKNLDHNLAILANLQVYRALGCALLIGVSRKSFIMRLGGGTVPRDRMPGSLAAGLAAVAGGAHILRVHDVAATGQALAVFGAIAGARGVGSGAIPT